MNLTGYERINSSDDGRYEMKNKEKILFQKKWDSGFALNLDGTGNTSYGTKLRLNP